MRHRRKTNKLYRNTTNRKALLRSLVSSLFIHERIKTTCKKAKAASILADKIITLGKKNTDTAKKRVISILGSKVLINKIFGEISPRFANRQGGYTRVLRMMRRHGDGAEMAIFELTERKIVEKKVKESESKRPKDARKPAHGREAEKNDRQAENTKIIPTAKSVTTAIREKTEGEKSREKAKSEDHKLQQGFLKGLRGYFRRKSG